MQLAVLRRQSDLNSDSDEELVDLARLGGESAVRVLIKRNNQRLFRVARSVLHNDADAEDVVQETYVKAFTRLDMFRGESRFSTWLTRIALNEALGRRRRHRPTTPITELDDVALFSTGRALALPISLAPLAADNEATRMEIRDILEAAIDDLPEIFRIVFVLRDVEDMSTAETGALLELEAATIKTRLHRSRRLLRAALEKRLSATFSDIFPFDGARCANVADQVVERLRRHRG